MTATDPPAGKSVPKGSKVRVNVMAGPVQKSVPNVVGQSAAQERPANLRNHAGFNPNPNYVDSNATPGQGQYVDQNPAPWHIGRWRARFVEDR